MTSHDPRLSVLITAGNYRERVANALASVLAQNIVDQLEVIVLECGEPNNVPVRGSSHTNVRILHFPKGVGAGQVRAEAVRMARAPFVVFLEEHAAVCQGWAEAILNAFADDKWAAIGPWISNGNPECGISDALSLCFYPLYEKNPSCREESWVPFHNAAYRRSAIMKYNNELSSLFALELLLQWKLRQDEARLLLEPAMKVVHYYETDIATVWLANHNAARAFAANWSRLYSWTLGKRVIRILGTPLMPLVRAFKLLQTLIAHRPDQLGRYIKNLPVILISYAADATGEFRGLLFGAGDADIKYLDHSVNASRLLPHDFPHFTFDS